MPKSGTDSLLDGMRRDDVLKRHKTRLRLNAETLRMLDGPEFRVVVGGAKPSVAEPLTCITCVFGTCTCRDCDTSQLIC